MKQLTKKIQFILFFSALTVSEVFSQTGDGNAGIDAANTTIRSYVGGLSTLMMAIGAVVGLIGAVRVYLKWNNGDQDVQKAVMGWMGSCIFLVVSGVVIRSFFGVS